MAFQASDGRHSIAMDAAPLHGGLGAAPSPKDLLLASLAGCMGISVMSVLDKMRLRPASFRVQVRAEEAQTHPKVLDRIEVRCCFEGDLPPERLQRAVTLSEERYCPVSAMLGQASALQVFVELNGAQL